MEDEDLHHILWACSLYDEIRVQMIDGIRGWLWVRFTIPTSLAARRISTGPWKVVVWGMLAVTSLGGIMWVLREMGFLAEYARRIPPHFGRIGCFFCAAVSFGQRRAAAPVRS
ncbi:hypothetical protein EVAR_44209_1 [Eumeta japonica]|uniref:Uncharacterized protein n=1 Tax=Eumeta variegata TaxID=151549 RepID=A0A4C1W0T2_EUMVA|nr:hypothetical protein EVAR_44209_1 [Eumeta japonica]